MAELSEPIPDALRETVRARYAAAALATTGRPSCSAPASTPTASRASCRTPP